MAISFHWFLSRRLTARKSVSQFCRTEPPAQTDPHIIMLVTCYSECEKSIKSTLDSLACSFYPNDKKLLFVVADGLITGKGNKKSTPDIIIDMICKSDDSVPDRKSYVAIADGSKQHNMAQVVSLRLKLSTLDTINAMKIQSQ